MNNENLFKQLQNRVEALEREIEIMKREYNDILSNIDYENLSDNLARDIKGA